MSFLATLAATVLEWLLTKLGAFASAEYQAYLNQQKIIAQSAADETQLQNAKTSGEKTDAANAINRDTFS